MTLPTWAGAFATRNACRLAALTKGGRGSVLRHHSQFETVIVTLAEPVSGLASVSVADTMIV